MMLRQAKTILHRLSKNHGAAPSVVTPEAVLWAYRLFLGREPDNQAVIDDKLRRLHSIQDLQLEFLQSNEFRQKHPAPLSTTLSGNEPHMSIEQVTSEAANLLVRMLEANELVCPRSKEPLALHTSGEYVGPDAQATYRICSGAVDLVGYYFPDANIAPPPEDFVRLVAKNLGIALTEQNLCATSEAIRATCRYPVGSPQLAAEVRELASRMNIEEPENWPGNIQVGLSSLSTGVPNSEVKIKILHHFIGGHLPAGEACYRSVRIRNDGSTAVSSDTVNPVMLSYHWADRNSQVLFFEGNRSSIPASLAPGEEITAAMRIEVPQTPGTYVLQIRVVQEHVGWCHRIVAGLLKVIGKSRIGNPLLTYLKHDLAWHEQDGCDIVVEVSQNTKHSLSDLYNKDIAFDFQVTQEEALNWVKKHFAGSPSGRRTRLLEVGGAVYPIAASCVDTQIDLVSIDISFALSQLGSIYYRQKESGINPDNFLFIAANAHNLPIKSNTFDGVILCRVLHHFADPVRLLKQLTQQLKPGGLILLACEPCNPNPEDKQYLRDIRNGINEQAWTLAEYSEIFSRAGLSVSDAYVICSCGLLAVLQPV